MRALKTITLKPFFILLLFAILLAACSKTESTPTAAVKTPTLASPTSTPTASVPTATLVPAAAIVNGERIPMTWFENEVQRYLIAQAALGDTDVDLGAAREIVLNDLVDQVLFAQGAREAGTSFSDAEVQARVEDLADDVDLGSWMAEWAYTEETLIESLRLQMLVANQRDRIADALPEAVEQVELRQVFAFTEAGANRALLSLNSGKPFEDVAYEFSPETGGYLGWVPRGYLLMPVVEEAVFNQPVGSYTDIIESDIGFHIVLVINREVRPLSVDARLSLQRAALYAWLEEQREKAVIEVLVD